MTSIVSQVRLCLSGLQKPQTFAIQKRFSTRESIHRYKEPEKFKKHMLAASEPYIKRKYVLQSDSCFGLGNKVNELEPLQKIYADELLEAVKKNDFVLFIQHNYTPFETYRVNRNILIKSGAQIYSHRNVVYREVFRQLDLDRLDHLFVTRNSVILGPVDKLPACVKAVNKMPSFMLLAGCIENEIYNYEQLQKISLSPDLDICRATLTSILETPAVELYQNLEQYVKMNSDKDGTSNSEETNNNDETNK